MSAESPPPRLFGTWRAPETLFGEKEDLQVVVEQQSQDCGGTSHLLPLERKNASFDTLKMTFVLDGSPKKTAHRRWLWAAGEDHDHSHDIYQGREGVVENHTSRFLDIHLKYPDYTPSQDDIMMMTNAARNSGAFGLHFGAFTPTILSQGTPEQVMEWLPMAYSMKITGCLGQTELGHGSNVRGLQTTAHYDKATKEFVLNTPTLRSMKWWPGGLGKTACFCMLYAQLILDGKELGFHCFIVQLRDENHMPMAGVEVGEVGPKMGDNGTETGFLRLFDVRIPREWMMMKNQEVTEDGKYVKADKEAGKMQYGTMLQIRAGLVMGAGYRLAQGVTIATRYSCVRQQGFEETNEETNRFSKENKIMDYQNQQYRLLKQLSIAYAFVFTGKSIGAMMKKMQEDMENADTSSLPEMHASSAGLKALCTFTAAQGLEDCRKCCGGHGVLLASGVSQMALDYTTYCTAEGDMIILELQSARFLLKSLQEARAKKPLSGVCKYMEPVGQNDFDIDAATQCHAKSRSDFKDLNVIYKMMQGRALSIVEETERRINGMTQTGMTFERAVNECAIDMVTASRAHCWLVALKCFMDEIEKVEDAPVKKALTAVCQLYGLINVQEDLGNFNLSRSQKRGVKDAVIDLLKTVRADVIPLMDAFEFSDNILNSALGRHDGRVYESLYASAKYSPMNKKDIFDGYKHIQPNLDKGFISEHAKCQRTGSFVASKL